MSSLLSGDRGLAPWIEATAYHAITFPTEGSAPAAAAPSGTHQAAVTRRPKIVQVLGRGGRWVDSPPPTNGNCGKCRDCPPFLLLSDGKTFAAAFLSLPDGATVPPAETRAVTSRGTLIKVTNWSVSSAVLCTGRHFVHLRTGSSACLPNGWEVSAPICLIVPTDGIDLVGGEGMGIVGDPADVNEDCVDVKRALGAVGSHKELLRRIRHCEDYFASMRGDGDKENAGNRGVGGRGANEQSSSVVGGNVSKLFSTSGPNALRFAIAAARRGGGAASRSAAGRVTGTGTATATACGRTSVAGLVSKTQRVRDATKPLESGRQAASSSIVATKTPGNDGGTSLTSMSSAAPSGIAPAKRAGAPEVGEVAKLFASTDKLATLQSILKQRNQQNQQGGQGATEKSSHDSNGAPKATVTNGTPSPANRAMSASPTAEDTLSTLKNLPPSDLQALFGQVLLTEEPEEDDRAQPHSNSQSGHPGGPDAQPQRGRPALVESVEAEASAETSIRGDDGLEERLETQQKPIPEETLAPLVMGIDDEPERLGTQQEQEGPMDLEFLLSDNDTAGSDPAKDDVVGESSKAVGGNHSSAEGGATVGKSAGNKQATELDGDGLAGEKISKDEEPPKPDNGGMEAEDEGDDEEDEAGVVGIGDMLVSGPTQDGSQDTSDDDESSPPLETQMPPSTEAQESQQSESREGAPDEKDGLFIGAQEAGDEAAGSDSPKSADTAAAAAKPMDEGLDDPGSCSPGTDQLETQQLPSPIQASRISDSIHQIGGAPGMNETDERIYKDRKGTGNEATEPAPARNAGIVPNGGTKNEQKITATANKSLGDATSEDLHSSPAGERRSVRNRADSTDSTSEVYVPRKRVFLLAFPPRPQKEKRRSPNSLGASTKAPTALGKRKKAGSGKRTNLQQPAFSIGDWLAKNVKRPKR